MILASPSLACGKPRVLYLLIRCWWPQSVGPVLGRSVGLAQVGGVGGRLYRVLISAAGG